MTSWFYWARTLRGDASPVVLSERDAPNLNDFEKARAMSVPVALDEHRASLELKTLAAIFGPKPERPEEP